MPAAATFSHGLRSECANLPALLQMCCRSARIHYTSFPLLLYNSKSVPPNGARSNDRGGLLK